MNRKNRLKQRGFTLLELLISITLLGMILVLLFGGLRLGVRSWDASQRQVDTLNSVRSVENFLRRELSLAYPYVWKRGPGQRVAFLGERNKLSFVAQLPSRVGGGGLYAISVELDQREKIKRIVWRHLPVSTQMQDFTALAETPEMVLVASELGGVEDIWLTYFGQENENENAAPRWMDRWENSTRLPLLIRVQVRLSTGSEWPDFVVAPMLSSGLTR